MFKQSLLPVKTGLVRHDTAQGRFYTTPKGDLYPSVTSILGKHGDKSWLEGWRRAVGEEEADRIMRQAARHGTKMHLLMERYLSNEAIGKILPHEWMAFGFLKEVLDEHVGEVYGVELGLWSDTLKSAGTADGFVLWDGRASVLDLKNLYSVRDKFEDELHHHFLQATAYSMMALEMYGTLFPWAVIIVHNGLEVPDVHVRNVNPMVREVVEIFGRPR